METKFAPPDRSSDENILQSNLSLENITYLNDIFCSLSYILCILNENRQIVFTNNILLKKLGVKNVQEVLGKRFGEAINCRYAFEEEAGCGTSEHCRYCGAVNTMLMCQKTGLKSTGECRIRTLTDGTENFLEVEVTATPFIHEKSTYMIFSLSDISDRKRKEIIERIFFHDLMNVAAGLHGFFDVFNIMDEDIQKKYAKIGASLSQQIIDEINAHRQLSEAENKKLIIQPQLLNSLTFIQQIANDLKFIDVAKEKSIVVDKNSLDVSFESDPVILRRVLYNMVKNALEASTEGQTVTLTVSEIDKKLKFSVHNPKFIPREVELQIFMRSFSTKGSQRGLGTYSMKILGEQSLGGTVDFTNSQTDGTTFFIVL